MALRPKEFDLLAALAAHTGAAVSRDELMSEVWDEHWYGPTKTLDVTMAALRRQLSDAAQEQHIPDLAFADRYYAPRLRLPPRPTPIRPGVSPNPTVIAFALWQPKPDSPWTLSSSMTPASACGK